MKSIDNLSEITSLEHKISITNGLIEIAQSYCDYNGDKSAEMNVLSSLFSVILDNQKELANKLNTLIAS